MRARHLVIAVIAAVLVLGAPARFAQAQSLSLVRDSEIEDTIRVFAAPLLHAAGLDPQAVRIYLVNDDSLNAFVAGGQNLFIHTGLLMRAEEPGQLIGVLAHEIGHIAGGHLARTGEALEAAGTQALIATLLGLGAAIAGGGQAGGAIIAGGQHTALRSLLAYTRTQERSADQAALRYLDQTGQSARGMLRFLQIISGSELLISDSRDPYATTHPLTRERIEAVAEHVRRSPHSDAPVPRDHIDRHDRMVAKLAGFLQRPRRVMNAYSEDDVSVPARYARAVAWYRIPDLPRALAEIDGLIADYPDDAFFHELKGQILFENGRIGEALPSYQTANALRPGDPLLLTALAHALIETGRSEHLGEAVERLESAVRHDARNPMSWRLLAIGYGRLDRPDMAALASAEEALLVGRDADARLQAARAARQLPHGSPGWIRAQDIERAAEPRS